MNALLVVFRALFFQCLQAFERFFRCFRINVCKKLDGDI